MAGLPTEIGRIVAASPGQMLNLHKQMNARAEREKSALQRQIDQLDCRLYGLTDDENRIVEDASK